MKAAFYERNGTARDVLRVGEVETPEPGRGEVRIRVHAAGVNPVDGYLRAGLLGPIAFPRVIPGFDGAGVVEATGPDAKLRSGERVWIYNGQWQRAHGTAAEYIVLPEAQVVPLSAHVPFDFGATIGTCALTAQAALTSDGPVDGKTVLVAGGAGATSIFAIQLAKSYGARVLTTVSSDEKAEVARWAGADVIVDYKRSPDAGAEILEDTGGRGVDLVVEVALAVNFELDARVLAPGGTIAAYGSPGNFAPTFPLLPLMFKKGRVHPLGGFSPSADDVAAVSRAVSNGTLRPRVWKSYPLAEIVRAHEDQDANRPRGKIVLQLA